VKVYRQVTGQEMGECGHKPRKRVRFLCREQLLKPFCKPDPTCLSSSSSLKAILDRDKMSLEAACM
jgi:hypothetical protein